MKGKIYESFTVTYLTPISNQSGDDIYYEEYAFGCGQLEEYSEWIVEELIANDAVMLETSEGLLYLNGRNIASIMFHEEDI